MTTQVDVSTTFSKKLKKLVRKYPVLLREFEDLITEFKQDKRPGDKISGVGYDVYKVRLRNRSAGKGKSGGFRIIYYLRLANHIVLLTIYSKTEQTDIRPQDIQSILKTIDLPIDDVDEHDG